MSQPDPVHHEEGIPGTRSRRANVIIIVVAAVLLVGVIALVPHFTSGGSSPSSQPPYQLATAAVQTFPVTVSASGTVVPASEVAVNFATSGQVSAINVQVGQHVTAGTVLAQLDSTSAESDVAHAQSAVASAQSVYDQTVSSAGVTASGDAGAVANDNQQLATDQHTLTIDQQTATADDCSATGPTNASACQTDQTNIADAQAALQKDQAGVQSAQARAQTDAASGQLAISQAQSAVSSANTQLVTAKNELANLTLVAPNDGTILQINGQVGENVSVGGAVSATLPGTSTPIPDVAGLGGSTSGGSPPIIVLGDPANLVVGAAFPSSDEPELAVGQSGTITDASLNGLSVPCHVIAIAPSPTTVGGTSVIYATVKPDTSTKDLYTGMAVSVDITVSQAVRVLAVPQSAIYLVSGIPHADVWDGGRAIATVVSTGVQGTTLIEVTSGLTAGQQVVLSAYQGLTQGTNGSGSS